MYKKSLEVRTLFILCLPLTLLVNFSGIPVKSQELKTPVVNVDSKIVAEKSLVSEEQERSFTNYSNSVDSLREAVKSLKTLLEIERK